MKNGPFSLCSFVAGKAPNMVQILIFAVSLLIFASSVEAAEPRPRACFSAAETREKIAADALAEPFRVMRNAAHRLQAEPISAKLCRRQDDLVYEISLLRYDGHVIHVVVNAMNGRAIGPSGD
jgi:hypothetical protein